MLSEKLMTMISGVITLRKMLRLKLSQPSAPSASRIAASGGAAAMIMKDSRRKNSAAIRQPAAKPSAFVEQTVALDGVADFKLHHRHAGQFAFQPGAGQMFVEGLADGVDDLIQPVALDHLRVQRQHHQCQLAVFRNQLAADDLVRHHLTHKRLVLGALRQGRREQRRGGYCRSPGAGAPRTAR